MNETLVRPVSSVITNDAPCQKFVYRTSDPGFNICKLIPAPTNTPDDASSSISISLGFAESLTLRRKPMNVVISSFATVKTVIGERMHNLEVPDKSTVGDVVNILLNRFGQPLVTEMCDKPGSLKESYQLIVNGQSILFLNGLETVMQEGDELLIFPPVCGG